jgi:anti-sigma-K factor RskA
MNCDQLQDSYELYALGLAEEPERGEIRAHLNRKCEVCMTGVKEALEVAALLGTTAPPAEPSAKLRRRILASVGVEPRRFSWAPVWAAATALALVAAIYFAREDQRLTADAALLRQQMSSTVNELTRLTEAFAIINGPETKEASFGNAQPQPPKGRVFVNPAQGVLLIASNLPPAPAGKLYEMWTLPKAGKPVPAGLFQSRTDGSALHVRPGALDVPATAAVAVTVENEAGADQPTSTPIIVAPLAGSPPQ